MSITVYRSLTWMCGPLVRRYLRRRLSMGKEDSQRFGERFGEASTPRPDGALVWIHAASVGESLSMMSVIERLHRDRPEISILITSGTVSSAQILKDRLPKGVIHQYVPVDRIPWVRNFLDHWRPNLILWVESEFWPGVLSEIDDRNIPAFLVNARISDRSLRFWRKLPWVAKRLLRTFELCMAQTELDADRLRRLGADKVVCPGNLKFAAEPLPADPGLLAELEEKIAGRPRWVAFSTHNNEEETIAQSHQKLSANFPELLTIIAPRHPSRGEEIADMLTSSGLTVARRSLGDALSSKTNVLLVDTLGELGLFFRVSDIAFVGGSLVPHGGQNPIEPARLGCAIVYGPHMDNFLAIDAELTTAGAAAHVGSVEELAREIGILLSNAEHRSARIAAASVVAVGKGNILDAVFLYLASRLNEISPSDAVIVGHDESA